MKLDEKDSKILELLKKNSRASNTELSRKVGLSEGAVRQRIKSLQQKGAIKRFTIETAEAAGSQAVLMATVKGDTKKFMKQVSDLGIMREGFEISGAYDACIILTAENVSELDKKIDQIRALKAVSDTRTFIILKEW